MGWLYDALMGVIKAGGGLHRMLNKDREHVCDSLHTTFKWCLSTLW